MSKPQYIKSKFLPGGFPVTGTVVAYLLFRSINPHGTQRGVLLTLFILYLSARWMAVIYLMLNGEAREPVFKDKS